MMKTSIRFGWRTWAVVLLVHLSTVGATISAPPSEGPAELVVFGDGYSDIGNAFTYRLEASGQGAPARPYFEGRFSDGPLWIEILASELRAATLEPSILGGTNYAWGHATSVDIAVQVDAFLDAGRVPSAEQLFVVWAGLSDFERCDFRTTAEVPDPGLLVHRLSRQIEKLAASAPGVALRVLVPNLPPLGATARARWLGEQRDASIPALLDRLTVRFNALLALELKVLELKWGIEIIELDAFALTRDIIAAPHEFGFSNVTDAARRGSDAHGGPPSVVSAGIAMEPGAEEYLYFDDIYPSSAWHARLAARALDALQEMPPTEENSDAGR